jgi:hypothetical protein
MSSKDVPKTVDSIYEDVMGNLNAAPDYVKFMKRAFKDKDQALVNSLLHKGKEFEGPDAKENVRKLLTEHLEQQKPKEKGPTTWAERVTARKNSQTQDQNLKK